jgi:nucleotide-binding universal stress UspA family protein
MTQRSSPEMIVGQRSKERAMYRNIVVGFNGSDESRDALALASRLRADDGTVTAVNVYVDPGPGRGAEFNAVMADAAAEQLASARTDTADAAWLRTETAPGHSSAHGLHDFAEDNDADLVVVGSSHRGEVGQTLAGTIGHRLLNGAPCPVAIAPRGYRGRPATRIGAVVVGVDGSHESDLALPEAAALAKASGADLELVAVAEPPVVAYGKGAGPHAGYPELEQAITEMMEKRLQHAAEHVADGKPPKTILAQGEPAEQLSATARADDGLLVVGSRAYGPLRRVLLGSVSTALVKSAPCPVIVVPRGIESHREKAVTLAERIGMGVAAVVLALVVGEARAVEWRADAASFAAPRLGTLLQRDGGDYQADGGVKPPGAEERVAEQADQQRGSEVGAEHVLTAFTLGRGRAELVGQALLGNAEHRHRDQRSDGQRDPDVAHVGMLTTDQRAEGLERDIGSEQKELDRDELLCALLGGGREHAAAGEAPHDHQARKSLDARIKPEADERDRGCDDAGDDRDNTFDRDHA